MVLRSVQIKMSCSAHICSHVWAAWRKEAQRPSPTPSLPLAYYYPRHRVNMFPREFHLTCSRAVFRFLAFVCVCVCVRARARARMRTRAMTLFFTFGNRSMRSLFCVCLYVLSFELFKQVTDCNETRYERHAVGRHPKLLLSYNR